MTPLGVAVGEWCSEGLRLLDHVVGHPMFPGAPLAVPSGLGAELVGEVLAGRRHTGVEAHLQGIVLGEQLLYRPVGQDTSR